MDALNKLVESMRANLPRRRKRRLPSRVMQPMMMEARTSAEWSMGSMSDTLYYSRRFRTLNILDQGVREALDIVVEGRGAWTLNQLI